MFVVVTSDFLQQCSLCKKKEEINFYNAFINIIERLRYFKIVGSNDGEKTKRQSLRDGKEGRHQNKVLHSR